VKKYKVIVSRTVTQSVTVEVEAKNEREADEKAVEKARAERGTLPWAVDENDYRDVYIGDPYQGEAVDAEA
jgi:hypothetical protein